MDKQTSLPRPARTLAKRWLLAAAAATALAGAALPWTTQAHWVYTAKAYNNDQQWTIHSPQGWDGFVINWPLSVVSTAGGTMYGYGGTGYWIAVQVACQNSVPSPWKYQWKSSPSDTHQTVNHQCGSGLNAVWTQGAISEP